jgi:hypothetical protein
MTSVMLVTNIFAMFMQRLANGVMTAYVWPHTIHSQIHGNGIDQFLLKYY